MKKQQSETDRWLSSRSSLRLGSHNMQATQEGPLPCDSLSAAAVKIHFSLKPHSESISVLAKVGEEGSREDVTKRGAVFTASPQNSGKDGHDQVFQNSERSATGLQLSRAHLVEEAGVFAPLSHSSSPGPPQPWDPAALRPWWT